VNQQLFCGTLICPLSIWQLGLKLEWICWNKKNAFPRSTDIIQVLNELPTDKSHIKVPQNKLLCPIPVDNKKKRFSKIFFLTFNLYLHDIRNEFRKVIPHFVRTSLYRLLFSNIIFSTILPMSSEYWRAHVLARQTTKSSPSALTTIQWTFLKVMLKPTTIINYKKLNINDITVARIKILIISNMLILNILLYILCKFHENQKENNKIAT